MARPYSKMGSLTRKSRKDWLQKMEKSDSKMSRTDLEKREGLTQKMGSSDSKNKRDWLEKVERNGLKIGKVWLEKRIGMTYKSGKDSFEKWEGLVRKMGRSAEGLNMEGLSQKRKIRFKNMTGITQKKKVLLTPHSHRRIKM